MTMRKAIASTPRPPALRRKDARDGLRKDRIKTTTEVWNDGRSGPVGNVARNLVLRELGPQLGEPIIRDRGLQFSNSSHLVLARFLKRGTGARAHWFNLSRQQYDRLEDEARRRKLEVVFLLVKCAAEDEIEYWAIPGPIIGRVIPRLPVKVDKSCKFEIHHRGNRFLLEKEDITRLHHRLVPRGEDRARLVVAFGRPRPSSNGKGRHARHATDWSGVQLHRVFPVDDELAVVLPLSLVKQANMSVGSLVSATASQGGILLRSVDVVPKLSAQDQEFVDELFARRRPVFEALGE